MVLMFNRHRTRIVAAMSALTLALGLASCSDSSDDSKGGSSGKLKVAASFYPIQWLTQQIGGDHVDVSSVTPAGTEPHDFEISTKQIAELNKTKALFYVKGFQPSLDDAVGSLAAMASVFAENEVSINSVRQSAYVTSDGSQDQAVVTFVTHPAPVFHLDAAVEGLRDSDRVAEVVSIQRVEGE